MSLDRFSLKKNITYSVAGFLLNVIILFISYKLVLLEGGLDLLGLWATLMAWVALIRIGDVGMASASLKFVATKNMEVENDSISILRYIDTGMLTNAVFFLVLSLVGCYVLSTNISKVVDTNYTQQAISLLPFLFVAFYLMNIAAVLHGAIQGLHLTYLSVKINVATTFLQLVLVLLLMPDYGLIGLAMAQIAQYTVSTLFAWYFINKIMKRSLISPLNISLFTFKEMLGYSAKTQFANIINGLFEPLSKILVNYFGGLQALGVYELAYKSVSTTRNIVTSGLSGTLSANTRLLVEDKSQAYSLYKRSVVKVAKYTTFLMLTLSLVAPLISVIWIGEFNEKYWLFVVIIASGFVVNTFGAPAYNLGIASGAMKFNLLISALTVGLMLILGYTLALFYQDTGTVLAVAISFVFGGITIKYFNEKYIFKETF